MALRPLALADQQRDPPKSSPLSVAFHQLGRACSAATDLAVQQQRRVPHVWARRPASSSKQEPQSASPQSASPQSASVPLGPGASPSNRMPRDPSSSSGGQGRGGQGRNQGNHGRSDSSSSAPQTAKRRRGATFVLASIPHVSYLLAETNSTSMFGLSDTMRHVLAGTAARTMAQAFIHPIDTVKTRLQGLLKTWRRTTRQYPFDFHVGGRRILHTSNVLIAGPRDVYLGLTGAVLGTIPTAAMYFMVYEWSKGQLEKRGWTSAATHVGSASAGAVVSALVRVPTDTLKHQVQAYLHHNVFEAARNIWCSAGVRGLYRGFWPTLARDVPEIAIQFTLYERLRKTVEQRQGEQRLRTWQHLLLGGVSGAVAASVTMPLDYVKTATQCGSPLGVWELVQLTMREKGPRGLFAGMTPRVAQTAIMSAMFFTLFEMWKAALKRDRPPGDRRLNTKMWRKRRDHVWKRQFVLQ